VATVVIRGETRRLRKAISFAASACLHGGVLAWVVLGGGLPERVLYDEPLQPHDKKIIWYRFSDKLPEIAPAATKDSRPMRARVKSPQTMAAGTADEEKPAPMIWAPDAIPEPKPVALPNVVAVAPKRPLHPFATPPDIVREQAAPKLAEPPRVETAVTAAPLPIELKGPKPAPRAFVPPPEVRLARQAKIELPEAPAIRETVVEANALPFTPAGPRPRPRDFVPPPEKRVGREPAVLGPAPEIASAIPQKPVALPKMFVTPPSRPMDQTPPAVTQESPPIAPAPTPKAETALAIVGLNPASVKEIPPPPASRPAGFSAAPAVRKDGASTSSNGMELLNVPGLTVHGGPKDSQPTLLAPFSPTSRENLMASARLVGGAGTVVKSPGEGRIPRAVEPPDPRLAGRVVYTIAIQMPNITSYSGSWQVWFAEREPLPGSPPVDMVPPEPLHKVDPKYVAAAAAERVEGTIRLAAVIRKDGHVDTITVLRQLDDRLDRTAQEALAKWEFAPALRNGRPVDVDAVFEIPFHLAPRPTR
jgi:TonB family protein